MDKWYNELPGTIAWKAGRKQWFSIKKRVQFEKGEWVAVNGKGEYFTTQKMNYLAL